MDSRLNTLTPSVRPKKSNNKNFGDLVDRISALHDSILGVILSFLPTTEEAVATTILSKRWKLVWTNVDNLCFYHSFREKVDECKEMKYIQFVNNVLHLHDSGFLKKFCLIWRRRGHIHSHAISWITTAITRKVHHLFLFLCLDDDYDLPFDMPTSLFCCDSIRTLHLEGAISVSDSIAFSLPKLEGLILNSVTFESEEAFQRLITCCPMLNFLDLHDYPGGPFTYKISSASMKYLEVNFTNDHSVILEAPSLEYLNLGVNQTSVLKRLSSLVEAAYSVNFVGDGLSQPNYCNSIIKVVRGFDYAKALHFTADVMRALSCGTMCLSTEFKRLVELVAESYCCACSSIQDFIQCSLNLEVITIQKERYEPIYNGDGDIPELSKWSTPVEVPKCLSNSLKKVIINGYEGLKEEREMIRYILEHGNVLEVMLISCDKFMDGDKKSELIQEIHEFPRKSAACKVEELSNMSDDDDKHFQASP